MLLYHAIPSPLTAIEHSQCGSAWPAKMAPSPAASNSGHLFVFSNRRRDRVKILYWDRDGFAVWAKRLEEGTYAMPFGDDHEARREITAQELGALLSGIDLSVAQRRKRYRRKCAEAA
jgi:transposase